jgi:hypothetical protein
MRRVFMTRRFSRWMRKTELTESALCLAVTEMSNGLIDADMGGGVLKKRVAMPGRGKSGSARTLLATNRASRWFFVFGFEKNERANVTGKEVEALQQLATDLLRLSPSQLDEHVGSDALKEICHDNPNQGRKQDS